MVPIFANRFKEIRRQKNRSNCALDVMVVRKKGKLEAKSLPVVKV